MIELLSSRKMIVGVIILMFMCVLIVILEGILTESELKPLPQRLPVSKDDSSFAHLIGNSTEYCWLLEDYSVVEDCGPCTDFEKAAKHLPICEQTGFKKLINCSKTGKVYISCAPSTAKKFWVFLLIMLSMSLLGALSVKSRIKYLEKRMTERMQNKLDCGV